MKLKPSLFENLNFDDFREMALNQSLSRYEKVGFPDTYRSGQEDKIFVDIESKLPALSTNNSMILDIGCGCSDLPTLFMARAEIKHQNLILLDSAEMLSQLADVPYNNVKKVSAKFPNCPDLLAEFHGRMDAIIIYSVIQYIFANENIFDFIDKSLALLAPSGRMLIGDIPNISMRKRFFASENGIKHHQAFTGRVEVPEIEYNCIQAKQIDDSVIAAIISRIRASGFHAFIMPQSLNLPMANRREDILIIRP